MKKNTVKRLIRIPENVDAAIKKKADYNCNSINSQIVKLLKAQLNIYEK